MKKKECKPSVLKLLIKIKLLALVWVISGFLVSAWAKSNVIEASAKLDGTNTLITLTLDKSYNYLPRLEPAQGIIRVGLHNLKSEDITLQNLGPKVKSANIVQSGNETLLEIQLTDMLVDTAGMLSYQIAGNQIVFTLNNAKKNLPLAYNDQASKQEPLINYDFTKQAGVKTVFYIVLTLVALLLGVKAYQKILMRKTGMLKFGNSGPKLLDVFHISPKQKIWIVEANNLKYMLAISPQSVSFISTVNDEQKAIVSELSSQKGAFVASIRAGLAKSTPKPKDGPLTKIQNVTDFKSALKSKLNKLKPLK